MTQFTGLLANYRAWPVLVGRNGKPRWCYWGVEYHPTIRDQAPSEIVLHYTGGGHLDRDAWYITKRNPRAISVHFIVGKAGEVLLLTPLHYVAWHAGHWGHNLRSIGIECVHAPYRKGAMPEPYPDAQMTALIRLCTELCGLFGIDPLTNIIGHRDVPNVTTVCPWGLDVREVAQCVRLEMAL